MRQKHWYRVRYRFAYNIMSDIQYNNNIALCFARITIHEYKYGLLLGVGGG